MKIKAVFFDVGETLVDETRQWFSWADWLGISRLSFSCALGAVIAEGAHHRRVFEIFDPRFDLEKEECRRLEAGRHYIIEPRDFYPDALPTLKMLKDQGYIIGIAGNQPEETESVLASAGVTADYIASSTRWRVEKPSPAFFRKIVETAGCTSSEIAYVGDRLDNDVLPAKEAGMCAVFLMRGPWGLIHARQPEAALASIRISHLSDLPAALLSYRS